MTCLARVSSAELVRVTAGGSQGTSSSLSFVSLDSPARALLEMQEGFSSTVEPDWDKLPIEERLNSKVSPAPPRPLTRCPAEIHSNTLQQSWKARLSAYTSLIQLFASSSSQSDDGDDDNTATTSEYLNSTTREWVRDPNAVAQEKGVEATIALVECAGRGAARLVGLQVAGRETRCWLTPLPACLTHTQDQRGSRTGCSGEMFGFRQGEQQPFSTLCCSVDR